jgi:hypothetical protein
MGFFLGLNKKRDVNMEWENVLQNDIKSVLTDSYYLLFVPFPLGSNSVPCPS